MKLFNKIERKRKQEEIDNLKAHINAKKYMDNLYINKEVDPKFQNIQDRIEKNEYKGIIIYAESVHWEPVQRPHHFLRELGNNGYLCFFLEYDVNKEIIIEEKYKNVYWINGQEKILPLLKDKQVIFLITYFLQYIYSENYKNKTIWFDVLDRLDFFSGYNKLSKKIWKELIKKADIVTYSARKLKKFIRNRKDAILLENACNLEDFKITEKIMPQDMKSILEKRKPIIGYYGAIESWFDFNIIKEIDSRNKYEIVIIGRLGEKLKKYESKNVHYLGPKDYKELKNYASHFDVAIIPFIINELTDNVSPVKFFEYLALNLPIISTPIHEMKYYKSPILKLTNKKENINDQIEDLLKLDKEYIKKECEKISEKNTWKSRIIEVEKLLKKEKSKD